MKSEILLTLMRYASGNAGAFDFLTKLFTDHPAVGLHLIEKIDEIPTLKGANLYILYSDLCNKDMDKVLHLLTTCPNDILEDACSRQDYSGRGLVAPYLTTNEVNNQNQQ